MGSKKLRVIVPIAILVLAAVGFAAGLQTGTLSAFGWNDLVLLCPIGALATMIASGTVIPRAVVSLVFVVIACLLVGRAFCGWLCPVPVVSKIRLLWRKRPEKRRGPKGGAPANLSTSEQDGRCCEHCSRCEDSSGKLEKRGLVDSRHVVLGGVLLSAAIFGFPVFCLICPIGLVFALVFLVMLLFSGGDITWSVIVVPALLLIEVVFFRKWCSHICPVSALLSLIGKGNRTFRPVVDKNACIESSRGVECGLCAKACEREGVGINPRKPEKGTSLSECTRCRACVDACPAHAISLPFVDRNKRFSSERANDEDMAGKD